MAEQTIAEKIQFQLQFMGIMKMCGRADAADTAYVKAQELTAELIELEKLETVLDDLEEPLETKTDYCNRMGFDM